MVTRFGNVQPSRGVVLYSSRGLRPDVVQQAEDAVHDARILVQRTTDKLLNDASSSEVAKYGTRYFDTDSDVMERGSVEIILANFRLIANGLKAAEHLKIFNSRDEGQLKGLEKGTIGWIKTKFGAATAKPYHNIIGEKRKGATHISQDRLAQGRLGVKTVIHEWSHKFADTHDVSYIDDEGIGFPVNPPRYELPPKYALLTNADSYAWFALKVGRRHYGFRNNLYA